MLTLYFGSGSPLEVGEGFVTLPAPGTEEARRRPPLVGTHLLRDDLDVPVMVVNSECETDPVTGSDSPTPSGSGIGGRGTSHISRQAMVSVGPRYQRDFGFRSARSAGINEVPMNPVVDAALHHMLGWVERGDAPPSQPRIEFAGETPQISRDEHGNARGGIRLPQVEVPIAHNSAIPLTPDFISRLGGTSAPFPPEKLQALYESQANYLKLFEQAAREAETSGAILPSDADALIAEAASAP